MATIKVRVNGEIATNLTPEVRLVCQNDKYDVEFEFDESWSNSNFKTALFIYNGKVLPVVFDREQNNNVCKIPALYDTELLHIGVKSSDVKGLHTSTPARVGCLLSANDIADEEVPEPTQEVYDQIIELLNKTLAQSTSVPKGGRTNQVLAKKSDNDFDTYWADDQAGVGGLTEEQVKEIVQETLPDWAEQEEKPTYTYEEITEKPDLVEDIGSSLAEETNVLTIELKDKSGKIIATTQVSIPKGEVPDLSAYVKKGNRDEFVRGGLTETEEEWTDEDKAAACETIGAVQRYEGGTDNILYGAYWSGTQQKFKFDEAPSMSSFPRRTIKGGLRVFLDETDANPREMATPRGYVDNLPDNLTLTDDEKAKWRAWLGIE
jgi:hypothetical protein